MVQDGQRGGAQVARDFSRLLSPIEVGPATLRNRVLVSAHQPGLAEDGVPGDRYVAYQRTLAAGGPGLQITGATAVHPTGTYHGAHFLLNFDDSIVPGYSKMADAPSTPRAVGSSPSSATPAPWRCPPSRSARSGPLRRSPGSSYGRRRTR